MHVLVAGTHLHEPSRSVHGFVVAEFFPESRSGLISYLAVDSDQRRAGLGRRLVVRAVTALVQEASGRGAPLQAVFAEIHDPERVDSASDVMEPAERVSFWAKLLARKVPIPYVQPELRPGLGPVRTLNLIALPLGGDNDGAVTLRAATVRGFLEELYEGEANSDLRAMLEALPGDAVELSPLNRDDEEPDLAFASYGIAFHFVSHGPPPQTLEPASEQLASFERDLLAYSYREEPPFSSRGHHVPTSFRVVSLEMSRELRYVSEGRTMTLVGTEQSHRQVRVRASVTTFRSGVVVRHLVLTPARSPESTLTEYDVIKLIKLWEGGEDVEGPYAGDGVQQCVRFAGRTIGELAAEVFDDPQLAHEQPRTGTVQLIATGGDWDTIWRAAKDVDEFARTEPDEWERVQSAVESLAGIVQGLVDFREIDADELTDVFAGVEIEENGLSGLSKGTLLTIGTEDRALDVGLRSFGVSPYLLIPHAVLLQNEEQLHRAAREAQRAESRHFVDLEAAQMTMHDALDRGYLPNVFHYSSERALYEQGHASRGLSFRAQELRRLLGHVETTYDVKLNKRRGIADDVRNGLLLVVSYTSYRAAFPHAPAAAVLVGLIGISVLYLVWRWAPPTFWRRVRR